jgi:hypothetical protein
MHLQSKLSSLVDNDHQEFTVYCGEWAMGRIYEERGGPDRMRWFWSLYEVVGKPSKVDLNGHAATLNEAKADLEAARRCNGWRGRSCVRTRSSYATTATPGGPTLGRL